MHTHNVTTMSDTSVLIGNAYLVVMWYKYGILIIAARAEGEAEVDKRHIAHIYVLLISVQELKYQRSDWCNGVCMPHPSQGLGLAD